MREKWSKNVVYERAVRPERQHKLVTGMVTVTVTAQSQHSHSTVTAQSRSMSRLPYAAQCTPTMLSTKVYAPHAAAMYA